MSDHLPPPRSILGVSMLPPEQGGGVLIDCDCGTSTQLIIEGIELLTETREGAVTCDGCQSVRWFTVGPVSGDTP